MSTPWTHPHPESGDPARGRHLVVLPVIAPATTDLCVASLKRPDSAAGVDLQSDLLVVDNSRDGFCAERYGLPTYRDPDGRNLGVARAWNVGVDRLLASDREYLTVLSASMLFGPDLHTSWTRQLLAFWGADLVEATGHSWHLTAIHRRCFERVGRFDSNYFPYAFEQIDWCRRRTLAGMDGDWPRVWVNALSQGSALHNQIVATPADPLLAYSAEKWGGPKEHETFSLPWGDKPLDYFEDVPIPVLAERYGLGAYGETWW